MHARRCERVMCSVSFKRLLHMVCLGGCAHARGCMHALPIAFCTQHAHGITGGCGHAPLQGRTRCLGYLARCTCTSSPGAARPCCCRGAPREGLLGPDKAELHRPPILTHKHMELLFDIHDAIDDLKGVALFLMEPLVPIDALKSAALLLMEHKMPS